jgi:hypothetical protein
VAYPNDFGDGDLDTFFDDFGVEIVFGGVTPNPKGILDQSTEDHTFPSQRSEVTVSVASVLILRHKFPVPPKRNDPITVDGVARYVNYTNIEADGRTMRVWLRDA